MNQIRRVKKRKLNNSICDVLSSVDENGKSHHGTKNKKGPLPMKMRALPQSFWQQPNTLAEVSPTSYCPPLEEETEQTYRSEVVGVANTELLFSLFHSVESGEEKDVKVKQLPIVRRGRPQKHKNCYKSQLKVAKDEDPYFASATVPSIQIQDDEKIAQGQQVLAMISVSGEEKDFSINNSFSERLSDLVVNL